MLCGTSFGLGAVGRDCSATVCLRRAFRSSPRLVATRSQGARRLRRPCSRPQPPAGKNHVSGSNLPISVGREAMGMPWVTGAETYQGPRRPRTAAPIAAARLAWRRRGGRPGGRTLGLPGSTRSLPRPGRPVRPSSCRPPRGGGSARRCAGAAACGSPLPGGRACIGNCPGTRLTAHKQVIEGHRSPDSPGKRRCHRMA